MQGASKKDPDVGRQTPKWSHKGSRVLGAIKVLGLGLAAVAMAVQKPKACDKHPDVTHVLSGLRRLPTFLA